MTPLAKTLPILGLAVLGLVVAFAAIAYCCAPALLPHAEIWLPLGVGGLGMGFLMKDASVKNTGALPSSAGTTVDVAAIDLKHGSFGDFLADAEVKITAPAVTTTMAPDTRTFTYSLIHSDNSDLSSPTVLYSALITQTGAGGAGAATANVTVRLPVDVKRYIGVRVVSGASTANASAVSTTLELLF